MRAVGPSQTSAEVCACLLSRLLLLVLLPSQMVPIALWPCENDPSVLAVLVHRGQLGAHLGLRQSVQEQQHIAGKAGVLGSEAWATGGVRSQWSCPGWLLLLRGLLGLWWVVPAVGT